MLEIQKELSEFVTTRPATPEEFTKTKENEILALPGSWETMNTVSGSISEIVNYGLADDYYQQYPQKLKSLTLEQVHTAAKNMCKPENVVWVVVGDREKIEEPLRNAGFKNIQMMGSDGQPLTSN
jgi:predicted Zn-dependent peptidase